jgi:transcriptional regulator with XRE-family HTH domain
MTEARSWSDDNARMRALTDARRQVLAEATPIAVVVGERVRELREARGWTQDQLVDGMRPYGSRWPRTTIAKLETGARDAVDLEHLAFLAAALEVTLDQLVARGRDDRRWVRLGSEGAIVAGAFAALLIKGPGAVSAREVLLRPLPTLRVTYDSATIRAARRLDIDPFTISQTALLLWGRLLPAEREWRLRASEGPTDKRTLQARRGHVTRQLLAELRDGLDDAETLSALELGAAIKKSMRRAERQERRDT